MVFSFYSLGDSLRLAPIVLYMYRENRLYKTYYVPIILSVASMISAINFDKVFAKHLTSDWVKYDTIEKGGGTYNINEYCTCVMKPPEAVSTWIGMSEPVYTCRIGGHHYKYKEERRGR
jgi:hypothetical protein